MHHVIFMETWQNQNAMIPLFPSFQVLKMVLLQFEVDRLPLFIFSSILHLYPMGVVGWLMHQWCNQSQ
jgi:hypothetical protein